MKIIIYLIISVLFGDHCFGQEIKRDGKLISLLAPYKRKYEDENYGLVVLEVKHGKLDTAAIGFAGKNIPMNSGKTFNIGSLTKTFTAALVLKEVELGNLLLTDSIGKYLPIKSGMDEYLNPHITIDQLLTHYSGLPELITDTVANTYTKRKPTTINSRFQMLQYLKEEPGTTYRYCNTNYIILGYLLEKINQMPFHKIIQKNILEKCNIKRDHVWFNPKDKESAHPMLRRKDLSNIIQKELYTELAYSAGGLGFNIMELYSFFHALLIEKSIISESVLKLMLEPEGGKERGLQIFNIKEGKEKKTYYGHGGDNLSFKCRNYIDPNRGHIVILLSNQYRDENMKKVINDIFRTN